ncbi:MAG: hypothetical protein RJB31_1833 [Bacteroidota bacterium]|jgi:hypothetical protein
MIIELAIMTMTFFAGMVMILLNPLNKTRPVGWVLILQAFGRTYLDQGYTEVLIMFAIGLTILFLLRNLKENVVAKISYAALGMALAIDFTQLLQQG